MKNAHRTYKLRRGRIQFGLGVLLILMLPISFGFVQLRHYLDTRPVEWQPFTQSSLDEELQDGKTVVVFLDGLPQELNSLRRVFDDYEVRRLSRSSDISMQLGGYGRSPYPRHSGGSYGSLISIFHPDDPTAPIEFVGFYNEDVTKKVIAELQ